MDYQARLRETLEALVTRVKESTPAEATEIEWESVAEAHQDMAIEAQEAITALFLESVGKNEEACNYKASHWKSKLGAKQDGIKVGRNEMRRDIRRKWQTNKESN